VRRLLAVCAMDGTMEVVGQKSTLGSEPLLPELPPYPCIIVSDVAFLSRRYETYVRVYSHHAIASNRGTAAHAPRSGARWVHTPRSCYAIESSRSLLGRIVALTPWPNRRAHSLAGAWPRRTKKERTPVADVSARLTRAALA